MVPFYKIAKPHRDILEGRHTPDVFAANLWEVVEKRAPTEYGNATQFWEKTYTTRGLENLLSVVKRRLQGRGGDPVIQIQTPFGGGKTHAMIAMYHKVSEWNAKTVVIDGAAKSAEKETLWGMLENQLTGRPERFDGLLTSPGRDALRELLSESQPVLILMDELLEYATKAAGVKVGDSTLAAQLLPFMQELSEASAILDKVVLVVTLPSGASERYGEKAEQLFLQLKKVLERVEKIYTPVADHEIAEVIRRRLFEPLDMDAAGKVINEFLTYARQESLLPGPEPSEYRKRFRASYPFLPDTLDVLYQRWGSLPDFQRTRGVLRLLAYVIYSLKEKAIPYISLADFDLSVPDIRQEFLKHIDDQYDSVLSADITGDSAGAKKVDAARGGTYKALKPGSRSATTIFLSSFSGGPEKGTMLEDIQRSAAVPGIPSQVIADASTELTRNLFHLQYADEKFYFTNQPNLNRILHTRMENIDDADINAFEEKLLNDNSSGGTLQTFVLPKDGSEIPNDTEMTLVVLKARDEPLMEKILTTKGQKSRANRNTLFFLTPLEREQDGFYTQLRRIIAFETIQDDRTLNLSREQKIEVNTELNVAKKGLNDTLRRYYRTIFIPTKEGFKESELSLPAFSRMMKLDAVVYEKLRADGDILENIHPLIIIEKYLRGDEPVSTEQLYNSSLTTRGELRGIDRDAWAKGIGEGAEGEHFGLGVLEEGVPVCLYFGKKPVTVSLSGDEVILSANISSNLMREQSSEDDQENSLAETGNENELTNDDEVSDETTPQNTLKEVSLRFTVPEGQVPGLLGMMSLLQSNFDQLHIQLRATGGEMSEQEYEDTIGETVVQLGIELE